MTKHPETSTLKHDVRSVAQQFQIYGEFINAGPYGSGHINDTYSAVFNQGGTPVRYIVQRINHNVFKTPVALMENVQRVTTHINRKAADQPDYTRFGLTLIPARDGGAWHRDPEGNYWRTYIFIENARTYDAVESPQQAFQAARRSGASRNSCRICQPLGCTTPSRISTTARAVLPNWKPALPRTRPTAPNSPAPKSSSPFSTNP